MTADPALDRLAFLAGGGETGALMRRKDWSATPAGDPTAWPEAIKAAVAISLASPLPIIVWSGRHPDELVSLHNDACRPVMGGDHHGDSLGRTGSESWPVLWDRLRPALAEVLAGRAVRRDDEAISFESDGNRAEAWFTHAHSPIRSASGEIVGVFTVLAETTTQKRADKALRESEARLQLALDVADLGTWELDLEHGAITRSLRHDQMFGYRELQPEWSAVIARRHVLEEDRAVFDEALERARQAGMMRCEVRVRHLDGSIRWIAPFGRVIRDSTGKPSRIAGVVQDITARKEAEAALRDSEEQLRLATEAAEIGLWDVDEIRRTLYWPARVKAMFGISPNHPVSMADFYAGLHPDDRDRVSAAYAAAADPAQRAVYDVEYRTIGKEDGVLRWVAAKGRGIFDAQGRCLRVIGTALDITARKAAAARLEASEAELRVLATTLERRVAERTAELSESERRFRAIFDTTFQLTGLGTLDGTLLVVNRAALDAAQVSLEQVTGQKLWESPWWRDNPREIERLKQGLERVANGEFVRYEARLTLPAGERSFDFSMKPVLDESSKPIFLVAEGRDMTDQRLAEEALRQAQKMEAIGQLTGGIAHDFNNLLQGVVGSFDLIRRAPDDRARVQRWADAGLHAAERGAKLTGQLLAFSRSQKLEVRPLSLTAVLEGLRDMLARTLGPSVQIDMDLDAGEAWVLGDRVQLEMAILNLAINARDAMPDGGRLAIATRPRHVATAADIAEGDYVELSLSDTGKGMAPEVMARAFDPFFTTKSVGKGTGLGLSQVYGAIRQAGGAARIRSEPGRGTVIELLLKRTEPAEAVESTPERQSPMTRSQGRVLVIDDDPDVRQFLADALRSFGLDVSVAEDGASGLATISSTEVQAVLIDYAMPGMNGAEVARRIKLTRPDLPILFVTGYADTEAIESVAEGEALVLRKPFSTAELQATVGSMLRR
jgi:PAS domain S-box-containing protein